jgi:hypothetical protein
MDTALKIVLWTILIALVLAAVGFVLLRWIALRIARHVAEATERAISSSIHPGIARTGAALSTVVDRQRRDRYLAQVEKIAVVMDRLIRLPVVGGIGLDAVIGLVPVVGDVISFALSSTIIIRAAQMGMSAELLSRLIAIQTTDLLLGSVPVVGDLIDVAYKANTRSAALIRAQITALRAPPPATSARSEDRLPGPGDRSANP